MRLGRPIPTTVRQAAQVTTLPTGGGSSGGSPTFVSKGTRVMLDLFHMHRRKDIWAPDAENLKPERWDSYGGSSWALGHLAKDREHGSGESVTPSQNEARNSDVLTT